MRPRLTVFLIQGWLRRLDVGATVQPLPLGEVDDVTWSALGAADAVVVSTEDLVDAPGDPFTQAARLRARIGPRPVLVLTLGPQGYLLDDPAADRVVASMPRRVVDGVPTVGAGDAFGAALAIHLARGSLAGRCRRRRYRSRDRHAGAAPALGHASPSDPRTSTLGRRDPASQPSEAGARR